jgi:hypothetical protein
MGGLKGGLEMKLLAVVAFTCVTGCIAVAQDAPKHYPKAISGRTSMDDALGRLARATTLKDLNRENVDAPRDFTHRAVYAAIYSKLRGPNADAVLLAALPSNGREMETFYDAQDTDEGQDKAVTAAYYAFYKGISKAVIRRSALLPQFLRMIHAFHYIDNVDEWPMLCDLAQKIYVAAPKQYMRAVNRVELEYREEALECREGSLE